MDVRQRPSHNRSSSLSTHFAAAPRPSFAPFSIVEPLGFDDNPEMKLSPQRELSLLRSFIQNTLSREAAAPVHPDSPMGTNLEAHSLPVSLNQSMRMQAAQSANTPCYTELNAIKIIRQQHGVERILWKKLVNQLLAVSVPPESSSAATDLCAELESELNSKPASEVLVRFQDKALQLYDASENWKQKCEFYVELLEQQNQQIAQIKLVEPRSPALESEASALRSQVQTLEAELARLRKAQQEHEETLEQKLKSLEETRKLAFREKAAIQEAYQRLTAAMQDSESAKLSLTDELSALKSRLTAETTAKIAAGEELERCKRNLENVKVRVEELEQELTNAASPYSHLHSIGEQLGAKFTTVSDLFTYLTANLQPSDPDQQCLLDAYRGMHHCLSGSIAASPVPSFIAAMLSFLLIRKKMIEEERELHGQTLLGLKTQLDAANTELGQKTKAYMQVALELNELKLTSKATKLDADLYKKRSESAEEELRVLRKAHERHIDLYKTELEAVQKRLAAAEKTALEKGVAAEAMKKLAEELEAKLAMVQEENEALEHENSFLAFERDELQKNLVVSKLAKVPMNSNLKELNATLSEIQQALRDQQVHEKELEGVIDGLHFQLEEAQAQHLKTSEELAMFVEDVRVRELERISSVRLRGQVELLRNEKEKLNRELRDMAQRLAISNRENEDLVALLEKKGGSEFSSKLTEKHKIEAKYERLKRLYRRLESVNRQFLQPQKGQIMSGNTSISELDQKEGRLADFERHCDPNWLDQSMDRMSEVRRVDDSLGSLCQSILEDMDGVQSEIRANVAVDGIRWTLIYEREMGYYWLQEGQTQQSVEKAVEIFKEIEILLKPYMARSEDVTLAFSRILQEYEQMKRSTQAAGRIEEEQSDSSGSVVIHSGERPPARLANYSDTENSVQSLLVEFARSVSRL